MENSIRLKIEKIIYGGYSIGRYDGITIFTRWGVPGDVVKVKIKEKKKNYYIGDIVNIIIKSPYRTEPACPYFSKCGGCQLQNTSYVNQLKIKEDFVRESLERFKTTKNIRVKDITGSPRIFGYRNKAQIPVKNGNIGFYSVNSHDIINTEEGCVIQDDLISDNMVIMSKVPNRLKIFDHISHVILRRDINGIYVVVVTDRLLKEIPLIGYLKNVVGVYQSIKKISGNKIMGEEFIHYGGNRFLDVTYFGEVFSVYPWSFLQVNDEMAEKLYGNAMNYLEINEKSVILDGYSGVGVLSVFMARKARKVFSVEYDPMSVVSAGMNFKEKGIGNIKPYQGDIESILIKNRKIKFNKVILDPPKKGLNKNIISEIIKRRPERIVYVSCNPQTLVRDLNEFISSGVYKCDFVHPFDLFPQTFHVEDIAVLDLIKTSSSFKLYNHLKIRNKNTLATEG